MNKIKKIVESRAVISGSLKSLEAKLSKLLTEKELKALDKELVILRTAHKLLEASIIGLDSKLKKALANSV